MRQIGLNIGIAFQIKDDLFDYGLDDVGKPKRNDIQERKVTLPLIKAFDNASFTETLTIRRLMKKRKKTDKDVNRIVEFVHDKNGLENAKKSMDVFAEKALNQLHELPVERGLKDFENLVTFITNRKK